MSGYGYQNNNNSYGGGSSGQVGDDGWPVYAISQKWTTPIESVEFEHEKKLPAPAAAAQITGWDSFDTSSAAQGSRQEQPFQSSRSEVAHSHRREPSYGQEPAHSKSFVEQRGSNNFSDTYNQGRDQAPPPSVPQIPALYKEQSHASPVPHHNHQDSHSRQPFYSQSQSQQYSAQNYESGSQVNNNYSTDSRRSNVSQRSLQQNGSGPVEATGNLPGWTSGEPQQSNGHHRESHIIPSQVAASTHLRQGENPVPTGYSHFPNGHAESSQISHRTSTPREAQAQRPTNGQHGYQNGDRGYNSGAGSEPRQNEAPHAVRSDAGPAPSFGAAPTNGPWVIRDHAAIQNNKWEPVNQPENHGPSRNQPRREEPQQYTKEGAPLVTLAEYLQAEDAKKASAASAANDGAPRGWNPPVISQEDSIRPSESASNLGSDRKEKEGDRDEWVARSTVEDKYRDTPVSQTQRKPRVWKTYAGDSLSDTSSQGGDDRVPALASTENKSLTYERNKGIESKVAPTGWNSAPAPAPFSQTNGYPSRHSPQQGYQQPQQQRLPEGKSPIEPPMPAPTPRRYESIGQVTVNDLERVATPRAQKYGVQQAQSQVQTQVDSTSSGRAISIAGATKYHAENMQLREEVARLQSKLKEYEDRLAQTSAPRSVNGSAASQNQHDDDVHYWRTQARVLAVEKEALKALMGPVLGILGLAGQDIQLRPVNGSNH